MIPLVLVHGFLGGSAQWAPQQPYFAGQLDLITVDLPGFGKNSHLSPLADIGGMADWVIAALRRQGVDAYHLLGHSMGGMIAQEIARRDADHVASLILYSTGCLGVLPGRFETIAQSKARAVTDGPKATARRIAATWFLNREIDPAYAACALVAETATAAAISAGLDAMEGWAGQDRLAHIKAETLVIWGDQDRTYLWPQIEILWRSLPHVRLAVVPDCAHAVHLEKPDIFNRIIGDFLMSRSRTPD